MKIELGQKIQFNHLTRDSVIVVTGRVRGINFLTQKVLIGSLWIDYAFIV